MSKNAIFFGIKIAGNFWSDQSAQAATKKPPRTLRRAAAKLIIGSGP